MARTSRFEHGNRWHAISMGQWKLVEVVKFGATAVMVLLFCWNLSMLSTIVQPAGHEAHLLRSHEELERASVAPSAFNTVRTETNEEDPVHVERERPWFLQPDVYEREVGLLLRFLHTV